MSGILDGQYHDEVQRRSAEIGLGFGGGGINSFFTAQGDDLTDGVFDGRTGNYTLVVDNNGARRSINTVATNGDYNHIYGASLYRRNFDPNFYSRFKLSLIFSLIKLLILSRFR